jgi:hypothetical protein
MTAKTNSINGVTRLHSFEISLKRFKAVGGTMQAVMKHRELGLPAGQWPDNFVLPPIGWFRLFETKLDGVRVYRQNDNILTVTPK